LDVAILIQRPTEHHSQFFEDEILFILCQLAFRIVFCEDSYVDVGQSLVIVPWFPRAAFLNRRAAARYRSLASIIPGPRLI
jgi:hypothetical protein